MEQKRLAFLLLLILPVYGSMAQEGKPLIQLNPFSIEGIGNEESGLIVSLVQSYLSDIGRLVSYTAAETPVPLQREMAGSGTAQTGPDYTISGTIRMERDGPVFSLKVTNTKTGDSYTVSSVYKNSGELALKTRSVLESAFAAGGTEPENKPTPQPENLSERLITGSWKAEPGIEIIRLMPGGKGLAVFSSGAQMVLSYSIEGSILKVTQISSNSERYYYPLPIDAARQLALEAEPMIWELSLYQGGTVLEGIRVSAAARVINGRYSGQVPGGDLREVIWTKTGR